MLSAPQHGPRPLPLFLDMLRSETAGDPAALRDALVGLAAFQQADRPPPPPRPPEIAAAGRARLIDYGGSGPPLVMVPSLINPPHILDLTPDQSLLRWLAGQGVHPLLVDWGSPDAGERDLSITGHVETMLLPLIDSVGEPPLLAGYCLGGTMAMAAAALRPVRALALIAAPWRFAGLGPTARAELATLWHSAAPVAAGMGLLPMEVLQSGFWRLDPARTVRKYAQFGKLDPRSDEARRFIALEDWANDGPPLTFAAARELMEDFVQADRPGRRRWRVDGVPIVPGRIRAPILNIVSDRDRIVPRATAVRRGRRLAPPLGHVGMIVGGRARPLLWEPLARWLSDPDASISPA